MPSSPTAATTPITERAGTAVIGITIIVAVGSLVAAIASAGLGTRLHAAAVFRASWPLDPFALTFAAAGAVASTRLPRAAIGVLGILAFASFMTADLPPLMNWPGWVADLSVFQLYGTPLLICVYWNGLWAVVAIAAAGFPARPRDPAGLARGRRRCSGGDLQGLARGRQGEERYDEPSPLVPDYRRQRSANAPPRPLVERRPAAEPRGDSEGPNPEHRASQCVDLERAMRRLTASERLILFMHFYLDLPLDEIGKVLGLSTQGVKSRMYRATRSMRPALRCQEEV